MLDLDAYHTRPMPDTPDDPVDAVVLASREAQLERSYVLKGLPRAVLAGALPGTGVTMRCRFSKVEGGIGVDAEIAGKAVLTCQRCLRPVEIPIAGESALILVASDAEAEQLPEGREPIVVEANHLDLGWLAEEEMLLALPLVPLHDAACSPAVEMEAVEVVGDPHADKRQRPFENLRELLKKQ
jgi:uncharacterized protein